MPIQNSFSKQLAYTYKWLSEIFLQKLDFYALTTKVVAYAMKPLENLDGWTQLIP